MVGFAEQGVGRDPEPVHDVVLEEPVGDDHVGSDQLLAPRDPVADDRAVMHDDLEVQARHEQAGVALAGGRLGDVAQPPSEREVHALDGVEQLRAVEAFGDHVGEGRVAFELGQSEGRLQRPDDGRHEVGQDVLGVIELGAGQIARVAGDVGDQQTGRLLAREHASLQRGARQSCRVGRRHARRSSRPIQTRIRRSHRDGSGPGSGDPRRQPPAVRRRATRCGTMNGKRP